MHEENNFEIEKAQRNNMRKAVDEYLPEFVCRFSFPQKVFSLKYAIQKLQGELSKAEAEADERKAKFNQDCLRS